MGQRVSSYFPRNSDKTSEETAYPLVVKAPERERDRSYATIESRKNQADKAIPCCKRGRLAILRWNPGTSFPAMEPRHIFSGHGTRYVFSGGQLDSTATGTSESAGASSAWKARAMCNYALCNYALHDIRVE